MVRLHEQLKYFVNQKVATDPSWQSVEVVLSGQEVVCVCVCVCVCLCSNTRKYTRHIALAICFEASYTPQSIHINFDLVHPVPRSQVKESTR